MLSCSHTCSPCFHVKQPHPTRIRAIRDQSWSSRPRSCPWLASSHTGSAFRISFLWVLTAEWANSEARAWPMACGPFPYFPPPTSQH